MTASLEQLFAAQLDLCGIGAGQLVGIIAEYGHKDDYVEAAIAGARSLGADAVVLSASSLSNPTLPPAAGGSGRDVPALLAAAGECDMVVDVTVGGLIHSDVRTRITGAGRRMLFVAEPADVLQRLSGTPLIRQRVEKGRDLLRAGSTLRVTSAAGTDLTADISGEDLPITCQWGYVDEPGRWDHWPSGFIACFPRDLSAQGTIMLQPGDALIPWQRYARDHVKLTVENGFITEIEGDSLDASSLREYFKAWDDPAVFATSHMGWGVHPAASWSAFEVYDPRKLYGQELRSVAGSFMWSTGSNRFANRETPAHLDIPMRACTVAVDDIIVVRDGELVE